MNWFRKPWRRPPIVRVPDELDTSKGDTPVAAEFAAMTGALRDEMRIQRESVALRNRKIKDLHSEAMRIASNSYLLLLDGKEGIAERLMFAALAKEKQAAMMLKDDFSAEPTRSILFDSAANLARNCGRFKEAEQITRVKNWNPEK